MTSNIFLVLSNMETNKLNDKGNHHYQTNNIERETPAEKFIENTMFRLRSVVEYYLLAVFCRFENGFGHPAVTAVFGKLFLFLFFCFCFFVFCIFIDFFVFLKFFY